MAAAYDATGDSFAAGKPHPWTDTQHLYIAANWNLDLTPDGKRFAAVLRRADSAGAGKRSFKKSLDIA